jgi:hypothetical protein
MLVNPDYSVTPISSVALPSIWMYHGPGYALTIDPTGSNLYLSGFIDSQETRGISVYPANGLLDVISTIAIPALGQGPPPLFPADSRIAFTPDGAWVYIAACPSFNGSIQTYSRNSDGKLTQTSSYALSAATTCATFLAVSPDGKYLADVEEDFSDLPVALYVQVYRVASDGTIAPALNQPFPVSMLGLPGPAVRDMIWDESSSYLLPMIGTPPSTGTGFDVGGVAALNFSGNTLTETSPPTGGGGLLIQRTGSFVYSNIKCTQRPLFCPGCWVGPDPCLTPLGPNGFNLTNGNLQPLPGSPFPYSFSAPTAIY